MKPVYRSVLWMFAGMFSFSLMAVSGRELAPNFSPDQILLFRSLIGFIIMSLILQQQGWYKVKTSILKTHIIRNTAHYAGQYGWFLGLGFLPLAEVFAIEFTVPIWTAIIAAVLLKEQITAQRLLAIVMGIIGMLIILRPGIELVHPAALAVLFGAMAYGLSHTLTRRISGFDSAISVVFYMTLVQIPIGFLLTQGDLPLPQDQTQWTWIALVSLTGLTGHYCLANAMKHADATVVIPLDFLRLPFIALVGYLFYRESVSIYVFVGALFMLLGNWINIRAEKK
jgi:drug/metabolite transporter (DMT)-like permease